MTAAEARKLTDSMLSWEHSLRDSIAFSCRNQSYYLIWYKPIPEVELETLKSEGYVVEELTDDRNKALYRIEW